ncbi:MAG: ABC transporter ATP-binding protein [Limnobacter sp.]|uniref:ABC transporter ATP-binding protein n=1 Tax=Limnobacter sp. TaxID=2003368 RepID=UPI00391C1847
MPEAISSAAPLLEVEQLWVRYGGISAVKGISFQVRQGELVCLIGCNGAGKTTSLKALAGLLPCEARLARLNGSIDLTELAAHQRIAHGMALVPEGRGVFARLTIEENLDMGAYSQKDRAQIALDKERVYATFPRLKERRQQAAGTMSGGEQQMLAMGRALMGRPRLLLLDEPSMGLSPIMVDKIFEVVKTLHEAGTTILLVEQNANMALQIADRGYVLDSGEMLLSGPAQDLITDPRVREAYLGDGGV